jgi:hypothetical protein
LAKGREGRKNGGGGVASSGVSEKWRESQCLVRNINKEKPRTKIVVCKRKGVVSSQIRLGEDMERRERWSEFGRTGMGKAGERGRCQPGNGQTAKHPKRGTETSETKVTKRKRQNDKLE